MTEQDPREKKLEKYKSREIVAKDEISTWAREFHTIPAGSPDVHILLELANESVTSFWQGLEKLANELDDKLQKEGWPPVMGLRVLAQACVVPRPGEKEVRPSDTFTNGPFPKLTPGIYENGFGLVTAYCEGFSWQWYAAHIVKECHYALLEYKGGTHDKPHVFARVFRIAELRTDMVWRHGHKGNILRGKKVLKGASSGGEAKGIANQESKRKTLRYMQEKIDGGHSIRRAAELAHKCGFGTSIEANRKLYAREK